MYLLIVFLPLLGALGAGFFGRYLGEEGAVRFTSSLLLITAFFSGLAFYEVGILGTTTHMKLAPWVVTEALEVNWGFLFDSLTVVMLIVVSFVSSLVHIYSGEYMRGDPHRPRFMSYLSLFTFFMLILVTADNYLQMFVGWEGVGLCSYLLINFWYTRIQANKAAIQAMIVNRVGDMGLVLGILAIYKELAAVDYLTVFAAAPQLQGQHMNFLSFSVDSLTLISLLLFVGAVGKSAQIGLHTWLPNAMEGPTPVSALIHAATMVTAGVFLLARSSPLLEYAPTALAVISIMGAMTAFFAATTGLLQNDLKKVIAYSTCSQLGYMIFACGLSAYAVGVFHLANHAFFKALLFLSAGSVIHAMADEQDMRRMGGLVKILPFTYSMFFIGSLALMGFPFLTGFYSKDVILELAAATYTLPGHWAHWLGSCAAFFTAFYSIRLLHLTFLSQPSAHKKIMENSHDAPLAMAFPLLLLSWGSIFVGYLTKDMIIGLGTDFWSHSIFTHPQHCTLLDSEFLPHHIKLLPLSFSLLGAGSAFYLYTYSSYSLFSWKTHYALGRSLYTFLNRKWFFDKVYCQFLLAPSMDLAYQTTYKTIDRGIIEILGPHGISQWLYEKSGSFSRFQSGHLYHYTLIICLGLIIPLVYTYFLFLTPSFFHFFSFPDGRYIFFYSLITFLWKTQSHSS